MNFLSIFAKNGQSNLVFGLVLFLESKGPYLLDECMLWSNIYENPLANCKASS